MKNATVASVNNKLGALEGLSIFRPTVLLSVADVMKGESRRFFSSHRGGTYSADGEDNEEEGQGPERAADGEEVRQELRVERHIFQGEVVQTKSTALSFRQLGKEVKQLVMSWEKMAKAVAWFGQGNPSYLRNANPLPKVEKPVARRTFLNQDYENVAVSRRTPPSERDREAMKFRVERAKADAVNYQKSIEERIDDFHRPKTLEEWTELAEARIRESMNEQEQQPPGPSINLLKLYEEREEEYNNPYVDNTTRIMYRIMKRNDCLPYWIELDKEIRNGLEALRADLAKMKKEWRRKQLEEELSLASAPSVSSSASSIKGGFEGKADRCAELLSVSFEESKRWRHQLQPVMEARVKSLNSKILSFNLVAPHMNFQKFFVDLKEELDNTSSSWLPPESDNVEGQF